MSDIKDFFKDFSEGEYKNAAAALIDSFFKVQNQSGSHTTSIIIYHEFLAKSLEKMFDLGYNKGYSVEQEKKDE